MPSRSQTPPGRPRAGRGGCSAVHGIACLVLLAFTGIPGCDKLAERFRPKKTWETFETSDGRATIRVPPGWEKGSGVNPEASLEAFRPPDTRLIMFSEAKADFDSFALRDYATSIRATMLGNMRTMLGGNFKVIREHGAEAIRVGSYGAVRTEIEAELMEMPLKILHVCVEGPRYVHQIVFHVPAPRWAEQLASLEEIIASFRERDPPSAPPASKPVELFKIAKAKDRCATLGVPKDWNTDAEASPDTCIAEVSPTEQLRVLVLREAKVDLDVDSLRGYLELSLRTMKSDKDFKGFTQEEIREGRIGGLPAQRVIIRASVEGVRTVQEIVAVQSRDYYYRLHTITLPSYRPGALPMFERVLESFRPAPDGPPPRTPARDASLPPGAAMAPPRDAPPPRRTSTPVRDAPRPRPR